MTRDKKTPDRTTTTPLVETSPEPTRMMDEEEEQELRAASAAATAARATTTQTPPVATPSSTSSAVVVASGLQELTATAAPPPTARTPSSTSFASAATIAPTSPEETKAKQQLMADNLNNQSFLKIYEELSDMFRNCPQESVQRLLKPLINKRRAIDEKKLVMLCGNQGAGKSTWLNLLLVPSSPDPNKPTGTMPSPAGSGAMCFTNSVVCFMYDATPGYMPLSTHGPVQEARRLLGQNHQNYHYLTQNGAIWLTEITEMLSDPINKGKCFMFRGPFPGLARVSEGLRNQFVFCDVPGWEEDNVNTNSLLVKDAIENCSVHIIADIRIPLVDRLFKCVKWRSGMPLILYSLCRSDSYSGLGACNTRFSGQEKQKWHDNITKALEKFKLVAAMGPVNAEDLKLQMLQLSGMITGQQSVAMSDAALECFLEELCSKSKTQSVRELCQLMCQFLLKIHVGSSPKTSFELSQAMFKYEVSAFLNLVLAHLASQDAVGAFLAEFVSVAGQVFDQMPVFQAFLSDALSRNIIKQNKGYVPLDWTALNADELAANLASDQSVKNEVLKWTRSDVVTLVLHAWFDKNRVTLGRLERGTWLPLSLQRSLKVQLNRNFKEAMWNCAIQQLKVLMDTPVPKNVVTPDKVLTMWKELQTRFMCINTQAKQSTDITTSLPRVLSASMASYVDNLLQEEPLQVLPTPKIIHVNIIHTECATSSTERRCCVPLIKLLWSDVGLTITMAKETLQVVTKLQTQCNVANKNLGLVWFVLPDRCHMNLADTTIGLKLEPGEEKMAHHINMIAFKATTTDRQSDINELVRSKLGPSMTSSNTILVEVEDVGGSVSEAAKLLDACKLFTQEMRFEWFTLFSPTVDGCTEIQGTNICTNHCSQARLLFAMQAAASEYKNATLQRLRTVITETGPSIFSVTNAQQDKTTLPKAQEALQLFFSDNNLSNMQLSLLKALLGSLPPDTDDACFAFTTHNSVLNWGTVQEVRRELVDAIKNLCVAAWVPGEKKYQLVNAIPLVSQGGVRRGYTSPSQLMVMISTELTRDKLFCNTCITRQDGTSVPNFTSQDRGLTFSDLAQATQNFVVTLNDLPRIVLNYPAYAVGWKSANTWEEPEQMAGTPPAKKSVKTTTTPTTEPTTTTTVAPVTVATPTEEQLQSSPSSLSDGDGTFPHNLTGGIPFLDFTNLGYTADEQRDGEYVTYDPDNSFPPTPK